MLSSRLTVFLFARNEEARLAAACANFQDLLPVVVVDNQSTDRTVAIAQAMGLRVAHIPNPGQVENPEVMRQVQEACTTDYLITASCSEIIPFALLSTYARVAETGSHDIVRAPRISVTCGQEIPISTSLRVRHPGELRMFRKGTVGFDANQVHSVGTPLVPAGRVLSLPQTRENAFYQFRNYDCSVTERNHCNYNDLWARQRFEAGERFRLWRAAYMTAGRFIRPYFLLGSWRHGMLGFIHCAYRAIMELTIQFRIWEHQTHHTLERVRQENEAVRQRLMAELREAAKATTGGQA